MNNTYTFSETDNKEWMRTFHNDYLSLILFITEQCNFRCVYCYEDFKIGNMHKEVLEGIRNLITNRIDELNYLEIGFFGGEPLSNKKDMIEISSWAKQLCEEKGKNYNSHITTNGYALDKETFENLLSAGITNYQITIDGEKDHHDKLRVTINGKGTFDKIMNNLKMMTESQANFNCIIRFNIADSNYESVKNFVVRHGKLFSNDMRFQFHFHPIFGMSELILSPIDNKLQELHSLTKSNELSYDNSYKEGICYAAKANNYVIRANGIIQKCTVALNDDINNIGKIFPNGDMQIDQEKMKKWIFAQDKNCPVQSLKLEKLANPYADAGKNVAIQPEEIQIEK